MTHNLIYPYSKRIAFTFLFPGLSTNYAVDAVKIHITEFSYIRKICISKESKKNANEFGNDNIQNIYYY